MIQGLVDRKRARPRNLPTSPPARGPARSPHGAAGMLTELALAAIATLAWSVLRLVSVFEREGGA